MGKKHLRKPTRNEKEIISSHSLIWNEWLIDDDTELEDNLKLVHKTTGKIKIISKYVKKSKR